jgi:hypothetical protein
MTMPFESLSIHRLIAHEVFAREKQSGNQEPPTLTSNLQNLEQQALEAIQEKVSKALNNDRSCLEMEVREIHMMPTPQ